MTAESRGGFSRREFFSGAWDATRALAAAALIPAKARAAPVSKGAVPSVLVDLTRCIGCRSCTRACSSANGLPEPASADIALQRRREEPAFDLWSAVNAEGGPGADSTRFVKRQCMHCLEPACASVCPVAALVQTEEGPVVYRESRCIGCRYCMLACPFDVPKFDWGSGLTPVIGKCQFCFQDRLVSGLPPACVEACPTGTLKFGARSELLAESHARINARPERYTGRVFGEEEVGGTAWLYLSDRPFEALGFKTGLSKRPLPSLTWEVLSRLPTVVTALAALFGLIAATLPRARERS